MFDGRTLVEALLDYIIICYIGHNILPRYAGKLSYLFIIPKSAENKAKNYSAMKITSLDSTHKIDNYKILLLHGTGVTKNEKLTLFLCFMRLETDE